jgi:TetR/AcrR family transcriptional repressor of nem operon
MRLTKEQTERNRQAIVEAASRLFRARGYDGVGLNEVMSEAGFTHGGFYNHFASKEALAAEACRCTFERKEAALAVGLERMAKESAAGGALHRFLDAFLSPEHRDDVAEGCPSASLVADAGRQGVEMQAAFARGIEGYLATFSDQLAAPDPSLGEPARDSAERRTVATALVAQMIGALVLSRAVSQADPALSDELLAAGRDGAVRLRTAPRPSEPAGSGKRKRKRKRRQ